jgi:hypothetical protein
MVEPGVRCERGLDRVEHGLGGQVAVAVDVDVQVCAMLAQKEEKGLPVNLTSQTIWGLK